MWSFLLCKSVWVAVLNWPKPCCGLDIITHLQITMMEALKLFVLLSSQKAVVAWKSCILMSSEIHHTQRRNREINMNKPKRAYWPRIAFTLNIEFVKAVKRFLKWRISKSPFIQYKPRIHCAHTDCQCWDIRRLWTTLNVWAGI